MAPTAVLSSAIGIGILHYGIIDQWYALNLCSYNAPKEKIWFLAEGAGDIAPFHDLDSMVPQEVKDKVAEVKQQIMDGTFVVPLNEATPVSDE
jgi:basic membrane lipoprotein Med (substrate-binding protein (PBP1-ABC) superfamily)